MLDDQPQEPWCVLYIPPNAGYVQMTSNIVDQHEAERQADFLRGRNFEIVAVVSQARLVAMLAES